MAILQSMKRITGGATVLTVALTIAISAPAGAAFVAAGGGTWDYGADVETVWSNYIHTNKTHKSSVVNGYGTVTSGWVVKGVWSRASNTAYLTGNHAYWDTL